MSNIDAAALAQARERLNARLERASKAADFVDASVADLRIVLDALREAQERHDWMLDQAAWLRHEHTAYVAVPVPLSSDLSCKATRAEAVDRAFQASRAAKEQS